MNTTEKQLCSKMSRSLCEAAEVAKRTGLPRSALCPSDDEFQGGFCPPWGLGWTWAKAAPPELLLHSQGDKPPLGSPPAPSKPGREGTSVLNPQEKEKRGHQKAVCSEEQCLEPQELSPPHPTPTKWAPWSSRFPQPNRSHRLMKIHRVLLRL